MQLKSEKSTERSRSSSKSPATKNRRRTTVQGRIVYDRETHRYNPGDVRRVIRAIARHQREYDYEEALTRFAELCDVCITGLVRAFVETARVAYVDPLVAAKILITQVSKLPGEMITILVEAGLERLIEPLAELFGYKDIDKEVH